MSQVSDAERTATPEWARGYSPFDPSLQDDPHGFIDRLRSECPVAYSDALGGVWVLSRYEDVHFALRHHDLFTVTQGVAFSADDNFTSLFPNIPLHFDPPEHGKYRSILNPLLSASTVGRLEPVIRRFANELLDPIVERGRCEFLEDFAIPFPSHVFVMLMGLPTADTDMFLGWKNALLESHGPDVVAENFETVRHELEDYFVAVYHERSAQADPGDDVIGGLLKARYDGQRPLTIGEFVSTVCLSWAAGLDTTTNQLSMAMHFLAAHPAHRAQLVEDPTIIPDAMEELIRYDSLVNDTRVATQDVVIGDRLITQGERVMLLYGAAGRDPEQFPNPDEVDFTRPSVRHFGFGAGAHRCVGSHLARLDLRLALEEIHRRMPEYSLDESQPVERHFGLVRGIANLHLIVGAPT